MSPSPSPCSTKLRLFEDMQRANSLLIALDNQHIEAVVANDWARSAEAEKKIHEVRTLRAEAVQAYRAHVLEHGC